uniref:zeta toxin family protein n=1 Tax=Cupriavidus taiwanensis TaxID=164546 RepID=UPI003F494D55
MTTIDKTQQQDPPFETTVLCFAGPNGSGKTTASREVLEASGLPPEAYINADDIAKTLESEIADYDERNRKAAAIAEERRLAALETGDSFAFETVMSTPEKVALLTQAKAKGYEVLLVFVATNNPEINVARVANRVSLGGHAVKPDTIRDRYWRALELLACAVEQADMALVYDNSLDDVKPVVVARKADERLEIEDAEDRDADWILDALGRPWQARLNSRSVLMDLAVEHGADPEDVQHLLRPAVAENGADYIGLVLGKTDCHVLQVNGKGEYLLHDRQLLATDVIKEGAWQCLQYRYLKGKIDRSDLLNTAAPEEKVSSRPKP